MANLPCDECGEEPGQYLVTDNDSGMTKAIGVNCFALIGLGLSMAGGEDYLDGILKQFGYAVTKAERDRRKATQVPEVDLGRTIATIVETAPLAADDEPTEEQTDESPGPLVDNSADSEQGEMPHFGEANYDEVLESALGEARPDANDPAPY